MKKYLLVLSCSLCLSVANAQLSCDDLAELTVSLQDLSEVLVAVDEYGVDTELDAALAELLTALTDVAVVEQDTKLTRWIEDLKSAWRDMDRTVFEDSLSKVHGRLDEMGYRDCNE